MYLVPEPDDLETFVFGEDSSCSSDAIEPPKRGSVLQYIEDLFAHLESFYASNMQQIEMPSRDVCYAVHDKYIVVLPDDLYPQMESLMLGKVPYVSYRYGGGLATATRDPTRLLGGFPAIVQEVDGTVLLVERLAIDAATETNLLASRHAVSATPFPDMPRPSYDLSSESGAHMTMPLTALDRLVCTWLGRHSCTLGVSRLALCPRDFTGWVRRCLATGMTRCSFGMTKSSTLSHMCFLCLFSESNSSYFRVGAIVGTPFEKQAGAL